MVEVDVDIDEGVEAEVSGDSNIDAREKYVGLVVMVVRLDGSQPVWILPLSFLLVSLLPLFRVPKS